MVERLHVTWPGRTAASLRHSWKMLLEFGMRFTTVTRLNIFQVNRFTWTQFHGTSFITKNIFIWVKAERQSKDNIFHHLLFIVSNPGEQHTAFRLLCELCGTWGTAVSPRACLLSKRLNTKGKGAKMIPPEKRKELHLQLKIYSHSINGITVSQSSTRFINSWNLQPMTRPLTWRVSFNNSTLQYWSLIWITVGANKKPHITEQREAGIKETPKVNLESDKRFVIKKFWVRTAKTADLNLRSSGSTKTSTFQKLKHLRHFSAVWFLL